MRSTFTKNGGNLGENGSVAWQFEKKGVINIEKSIISEEDLMEIALDCGAEDVVVEEEGYTIKTELSDFHAIDENLRAKKIEIINSEVTMVAKNFVKISQEQAEKLEKLLNILDDLDDTQSVSSNEEVEKNT